MLNAVILGAGAMGCLYASYLCKNPNISLTLLDHRAAKVDEINKNGLLMVENDQEIPFSVPAKVSGRGRQEPVDILLIFVKAHQTYAALKANRSLIGPKTVVVSLQNGMGNYLEIVKFVPLDRIVIGTSNHNSTLLGSGHFLHAADGKTIIGAFSKDSPHVELIRSIFDESGLDISVSNDVRVLIWRTMSQLGRLDWMNPFLTSSSIVSGLIDMFTSSLRQMSTRTSFDTEMSSPQESKMERTSSTWGESFENAPMMVLPSAACRKCPLPSSVLLWLDVPITIRSSGTNFTISR